MTNPPDTHLPERLLAGRLHGLPSEDACAGRSSLANWLHTLPWRSLVRWWIVGIMSLAIGTAFLYIFVGVLRMPLMTGTLFSAECTLLVRFFINDSWVFAHRRPTWKRLGQFHLASLGGSAIWWVVANGLPKFGVHYLVASAAGSVCSMLVSIMTNFFWIWRNKGQSIAVGIADTEAAGGRP